MKPSIYIGGKYSDSPLEHRRKNGKSLKIYMSALGYKIVDFPSGSEIFIALDHFKGEEQLLFERKSQNKFSILFRNEPRCVLPSAYETKTTDLYSSVLNFGKSESFAEGLHWPQHWPYMFKAEWESSSRLTKTVAMNSNKLSLSSYELYSFRRKCFNEIETIDVFGENWNSSFSERFKTLVIELKKDPIRHLLNLNNHAPNWFNSWPKTFAPIKKIETIQQYKINLVIENEITYMSEKLFDAFFAGCIPIYVGPDVVKFGIPQELVLQSSPTLEAVKEAILEAEAMDLLSYQANLRSWLECESTRELHESANVLDRAFRKVMMSYESFEKTKCHKK